MSIPNFSRLNNKRFFAAAESKGLFTLTPSGLSFLSGNEAAMMPELGVSRGIASLFGRNISEHSFNRLTGLAKRHNVSLPSIEGLTFNDIKSESSRLPEAYKGEFKDLRKTLQSASDWEKASGLKPILMKNASAISGEAEELIRHEDIHVAHFANQNHSFFKQAEIDSPTLNESVTRLFGYEPGEVIPETTKNYIDKTLAGYDKQAQKFIDKGLPDMAKFSHATERLAYAHQENPEFLKQAHAAGARTRENVAKELLQQAQTRRYQIPKINPETIIKEAASSSGRGWMSSLIKGAKKMSGGL